MSSTSYNTSHTIAAEATPSGRGGVSVIRISGAEAGGIVGRLFDRELPGKGEHRFGRLLRRTAEAENLIDEVVISCFKAPNSYTGEDVYEISTHGSPVVTADTLSALYEQGARPAAPGEFTLRAFLNGRIDLTQAEAVADLVNASSRDAADQALKQLGGGIGRAAEKIGEKVMKLLTQCELELDFVEDDVELISRDAKIGLLNEALSETRAMLEGYHRSRRLREGVNVAITGPPNVGKSSLFNSMVGEERAIVHREPGTTRDTLQAECVIKGIGFQLFDTAGIRATASEVEDEGVRRAYEIAERAELVIAVNSVDVEPEVTVAEKINGVVIKVLNKIDMAPGEATDGFLPVSAKRGDGLDDLKDALYGAIVKDDRITASTVSRERHFNAVSKAEERLRSARRCIEEDFPAEMTAEELREAAAAMDELTGKRSLDEMLEGIFSNFCIGK